MNSILEIAIRATDEASAVLESVGAKMGSLGAAVTGTGLKLTAGVTAPLMGLGAAALIAGNEFSAGMANVISLVPNARDEIAALSKPVQDLSVEMGKSTSDMTAGLYQVVSAFGLTDASMEVLKINAMAASAGLATTTQAIDLTSAVTKAYGDTSAAAVQQVADLAMKTVAMGQTTFPELASSIGRVTPLASAMNVSMEELFGVMATGSGVTGSAAEVSTQFRGILQSLMAPTKEMAGIFEELGVSTGAQLVDVYGLEDGLANIMQIAEATGKPLQSFISSIEGQTLAMVLAGPQSDVWTQKTGEMRDAAGAAGAAFQEQTQGVNEAGFAWSQAKVAMEVVMITLRDALAPAVKTVTELFKNVLPIVQGLIDKFTSASPSFQTLVLGLGAVAVAAGPVLMALGTVASIIGAVLSPIGLLVAAIAALAIAWATDFLGIRTAVTEFWEVHLKPIFDKLVLWLQTNIPLALETLSRFWEETLLPAIKRVWDWIEINLVPLLRSLANLYLAGVRLALAALALIWETVLKPALQALWKWIELKVVPALKAFGEKIEGPLATALGVFEKLLSAVSDAVNGISDGIDGVIGWIDKMIQKLADVKLPAWITSLSGGIAEALGIGEAESQVEGMRAAIALTDHEFSALAATMNGLENSSIALSTSGLSSGRYGSAGISSTSSVTNNNNWSVTVMIPPGSGQDVAKAAEQGVLRAARSMGLR